MSGANWKTALASMVAAAALVCASASFAQQQRRAPAGQGQGPAGAQPAPGMTETSIDEATLDKFASAYTEIQEIHDDYSGRLQEVDNQEEAMELQREAQSEMLQVVRENDLSVREYNHVATMMNQDPELRERVHRKIGE